MTTNPSVYKDRVDALIQKSVYISRDLSWLQFNHRVLDQAKNKKRNVLEQLKFIAITASNLDEFFMVQEFSRHYELSLVLSEISLRIQ